MLIRYTLDNTPTDRGLTSELRIGKAGQEDRGEYVCTASNPYGHAKGTIHLLVQEPPNFPRNLHVVDQKSRSIRLAWSSPSGVSGQFNIEVPVTKYIVQYKESRGMLKKKQKRTKNNWRLARSIFKLASCSKIHQNPSFIVSQLYIRSHIAFHSPR